MQPIANHSFGLRFIRIFAFMHTLKMQQWALSLKMLSLSLSLSLAHGHVSRDKEAYLPELIFPDIAEYSCYLLSQAGNPRM